MSEQKNKRSRAIMTLKKLDELLIQNGYEPTKKANKKGSYVHILPKR